MKLREDSEPYCLAWLGIILLTAYYFSFFYEVVQGLTAWGETLWLMAWPLLALPFYYRYFAVERGKSKTTMLSLAAVFSMFYVLYFVVNASPLDVTMFLSSWSIGSVIMIAGGFAMLRSEEYTEEAFTPGIMDVSKLSYGPPVEEPESETLPEVEVTETAESETGESKPETEEPSAAPEETTE
ncbi:MAG: hypothetical protein ACW98Y_04450 [Candidatus Thorarchaeota archaeon]|jgi:hypothetical protein